VESTYGYIVTLSTSLGRVHRGHVQGQSLDMARTGPCGANVTLFLQGFGSLAAAMNVLITGGAGFIGSHLADRLLAEGHTVRALDNLDAQVHPERERPDYLDPEVELVAGDVREHDAVGRALDGIDTVVHFAAAVGVGQSMYEIERYTSINAIGAAVVLEEAVARRDAIRKLLVASSMSIYGEGQYRNPRTGESGLAPWLRPESQLAAREWDVLGDDGTPLEPEPTAETKILRPTSIYAITKRDHEEMFLAVGAADGIPAVALRFFNVYGERQALSNPYTGVAAIFSSRILNDRSPLVFEDGRQTRDFIDVRDIARGCSLALTRDGADGRTVNLGTGVPTSILEVAAVIARGLGKEIEPEVVEQYRAGDIRHCYADTRLGEELLGFRAEIPFEHGMQDLLAWLEGQEAADSVDAAREALVARGLAR
jgi:dTDP-L-rhamnose 4-epimerase